MRPDVMEEERFKLHQFHVGIPLSESGYDMVLEPEQVAIGYTHRLHVEIFSKQPEKITYQPLARLVRRWGQPRGWFQRLKLRRGFGWLRCFSEVELEVETARLEPPRVDITGMLLYPGAAVSPHRDMGYATMSFLDEGIPDPVEVEYAPSQMRPIWVPHHLAHRIRSMADKQKLTEAGAVARMIARLDVIDYPTVMDKRW